MSLFLITPVVKPAQYIDRLTITSYADERGYVVWSSLAGTFTDKKGKRWQCETTRDTDRATLDATLWKMRDDDDAEFSIRYQTTQF